MKYAVVCCSGEPLAFLNIQRSRAGSTVVRVQPVATPSHMQIVVNPTVDGHSTWQPDELAKMTHSDVNERNVTQIRWTDTHRSWVIRCGPDCMTNQEAQIREDHLPKIAAKITTGTWQEQIDGMPVIPLGVLSFLTDPRNW